MEKTKLTNSEIKKLFEAYTTYKNAEKAYKKIKDSLCENLVPGKYESEEHTITKTVCTKGTIDVNRILADYRKINPDKYTTYKEYTLITIK